MTGFVTDRDALLDHGDPARAAALDVVEATFAAVQPERLVPRHVRLADGAVVVDGERYALDALDDVAVIGAGKGSRRVVEALLDVLGDAVTDGVVVEKRGQGGPLAGGRVRVLEAGHPVPDEASEAAAEVVLERADAAGAADLVFVAVTGGASAVLAAPVEGVTLADLRATNEALLLAGAPIEDLNAVRKHLSRVKGGRLARRIAPARLVSLIVVDEVAGAPWGPTVPDPTTAADAVAALERHGLWDAVPASVREHLDRVRADASLETPDAAALSAGRARTVVLADAADLCDAAAAAARDAGLAPLVLSSTIEGEASEVGTVLAGIAREVRGHGRPVAPPCAVLSGGETTVAVGDPEGAGTGGPNQELALSAARRLAGLDGVALAAVDTDGTDGPTDVAGGLVCGRTAGRARSAGVDLHDALRRHDATAALEPLGDAVRTRPTGTNLMDLRVLVVTDGG